MVSLSSLVICLPRALRMIPLLIALLFFLLPKPVYARFDPFSVPNNRFGIHVADPNDIPGVGNLVNGNGGDWGYVTLVINDDDRQLGKWQDVFNKLRRQHVIPIVRLATHPEGDYWTIPKEDAPGLWAEFLNKLNWPEENRYVIVYNEPNHAKEWGNTLDPEGYADIFLKFSTALKAKSPDFFVIPAGLDVSASSDGEALDASVYLSRMVSAHPELLSQMDGWSSHSYPNPNFSGSPYGAGRGTLRSYAWERDRLRELGLTGRMPIFITETGWSHAEGRYTNRSQLSADTIASYLPAAASGAWSDPDIIAVTPFVYSYQGEPFDHFSWKRLNSDEFYPIYSAYQRLPKPAGQPKQYERFATIPQLIPDKLIAGSVYTLITELSDTGQSIADPNKGYALTVRGGEAGFSFIPHILPSVEPGDRKKIAATVKTTTALGTYHVQVLLTHDGKEILIEEHDVSVVPPPNLSFTFRQGWKSRSDISKVKLLIYDENEHLIHEFDRVPVKDGSGVVTNLLNVVPGMKYRVVVLAPYYLPRQELVVMDPETTWVAFRRLLPGDFNRDGTLSMQDVFSLLTLPPITVIRLFIGR